MTTDAKQPYVLIVDDEPNNLLLLQELLGAEDYRTHGAKSGMEALAAVECEVPDLILLDVMMPGMNGFDVCRQLRNVQAYSTIPVIFLTALDDEASRITGMETLSDDYLTKPIRSGILLSKIRNLLRLQQMRRQQLQQDVQLELDTVRKVNKNLAEKFRLFVPEQFLQRIAPEGLESISVGNAHHEELTILFCDIREFTAIAEGQDPKQTFTWLNSFFEAMNQAIATHHGFVDKFLGDAIMAVFDRPGNHATDAVQAALMMNAKLQRLNLSLHNLPTKIRMGIGIHTGEAMIGTVGSSSRIDSTVIGDVVNTASRLEELTKTYHCDIIASGQTRQAIAPTLTSQWRLLDQLKPRGKQQCLDLYQVQTTPADEHSK